MSETTPEARFFGVSTPLQTFANAKDALEEEIEIEIIDDDPLPDSSKGYADDEEELAQYSGRVQKRINKFRYAQHEAERSRDDALRMRDDAIQYTRRLVQENQANRSLIQRGESALVAQIKEKASISLEQAKSQYREAHEQGDSEKILSANERFVAATADFREAEKHERVIRSRPAAPVQQIASDQIENKPPEPSQKAVEWKARNKWFGSDGNRPMTALAYGIHEDIVRKKNFVPDSDEYYEAIDAEMRGRFPEAFDNGGSKSLRRPNTVVAPSNRSTGTKRKTQLTASMVRLTKKLGITPEAYAKSLLQLGDIDG